MKNIAVIGTAVLLAGCLSRPIPAAAQDSLPAKILLSTGHPDLELAITTDAVNKRKDLTGAFNRVALFTLLPTAAGISIAVFSEDGLTDLGGGLLIGYGMIYGPAHGNYYAENRQRERIGIGLRTAGFAGVIIATVWTNSDLVLDVAMGDFDENRTIGYITLGISYGMYLAGIVYTFSTIPKSVREYNEELEKDNYEVRVAPSVDPFTGTPLISARISF